MQKLFKSIEVTPKCTTVTPIKKGMHNIDVNPIFRVVAPKENSFIMQDQIQPHAIFVKHPASIS